jgi:predicted Zn-dependent peptidase
MFAYSYEPKHLEMKRPVQQSYVAFGFPTPASTHPDHETLDVLSAVLGDGRSSRLVHTLREKKKIVWSVTTGNYSHEGPGLFCIFAECRPDRRSQLRRELDRILGSRNRKSFSDEEVTRAQNLLHHAWLQSFETYHQQAACIGLYAMDNQLPRLNQYLQRIFSVTVRQLERAAAHYLDRLPLSTAIVHA